jgi:hypothetical protein
LYLVPGYSGGAWPGQPDVDWDGGAAWKLTIARPHDLPDAVKCSYLPPKSGNIAKILFSAEYASELPIVARPLWQELTSSVATQFGQEAIVKLEDMR